ncbi:MAG TPA: ABC transporter substrate-binding protein [Micromonosporaceae bacterium]|nr:ABC transporter substrate-binding protein [Micromonosporaceae bacterium]
MSRKRNLPGAVLIALVMTTGASACSVLRGSESGDSSDDTIRIMNIGIQTPGAAFGGIAFPYGATGVKAAAEAINANGGIDGRMIKVDVCDSKGDPNSSAQCARTAVANKDIAVVGTFDPIGASTLLPVLEEAKIPYLGGLPTTPAEFTSPVSFQFDPGPVLSGPAMSKLWADSGCARVTAILPANPGSEQTAAEQKKLAAGMGVSVDIQLIQPGIADITPSLTTALAFKPDCFTYGGDGQTNVKYILGLKKLGFTGKIITSSGALTPQFLPPLGAASEGILVLGSALLPTSDDPMVKQFRSELSDYLDGDQKQVAMNLNEFAQVGWSSVQLLKQALAKSGEVSAKAILDTIPTMCDVNVGNVYPHVNFCEPVADSPVVPRLYNDQWQYYKVKDGQYVPTDGAWHDLASTAPGTSAPKGGS